MKNLKLIYSLLTMLVAGLFASCTNDNAYTPGSVPAGPQVCFSNHNVTVFNISGEEKDDVQNVILTRMVTDTELEVPIIAQFGDDTNTYDETLFEVPASVVFEKGKDVAELAIKANSANMEEGKEYKITLLLGDETQGTPYGEQKWEVAFRLFPWDELKGELSNYGKFCGGDAFTGLDGKKFSVLSYKAEVEVKVYTHKTKAGAYLLYNPWDKMAVPALGAAESEEDPNKAKHLVINCENPEKCYIEKQGMGLMEQTDSEWCIVSDYHPTTNPTGLAGVLNNGVITWPAESLLIGAAKYKGGNMFVTNLNGMFRIVLPDGVPTDYSLNVKYDGMNIASDYEDVKAKFTFTHGADVMGVKYYLAEGNVSANPADAIAALINGTATNICEIEDFNPGSEKTEINITINKAGLYTIIAAPKDKANELVEKYVALDSFYYSGIINSGDNPCDITVTFGKYTDYYTDEPGDDIGDYNSFGYNIKGTQLKAIYVSCWPTTFITEYIKKNGGATNDDEKLNIYKKLFNEEGVTSFTLEELAAVHSTEGKNNFYGDLEDNTDYTAVILAVNDYETRAIVEHVFKTDVAPAYTGELKEGKFVMKSKSIAFGTFETTFELKSYQGSSKTFIVSNLGYDDGSEWFATYDAAAETLTLDGTIRGRKKEGNLFGKLFGYVDEAKTICYQYESLLVSGSLIFDPFVFNIDATSKQPTSIQNYMFKVQAYKVKQDRDGNDIPGDTVMNSAEFKFNKQFEASSTTITPYVEPQAPETGEGSENTGGNEGTEGGENTGGNEGTEGGENTENK